MKSWLIKFRISTALDAGKPLPDSLRQKIAADPELKHFVHQAEVLGRPLRSVPPASPALHDSIMRAVRNSAKQQQPRRTLLLPWLSVSATFATAVMVCLWLAYPRPVPTDMPSPFGGLAQLVKRAVAGAVLP